MKKLISIILPSYNDAAIIQPYFEAITQLMNQQAEYDYEMIYVDDGSSDDSNARLTEIANKNSHVTFIQLYKNFGQQRALLAGLERAKGEIMITLDGDFQYQPNVILQLANEMKGDVKLVSGIRKKRKDPIFDKITSKFGNTIINQIFSMDIKDFGSVKAFSRDLVDNLLKFRHFYSDVYPSALSLSPNMVEIEVEHLDRHSGTSHWNLWMRLKLFLDLYITYGQDHFQLPFKIGIGVMLTSFIGLPSLLLYKLILFHEATVFEILFSFFLIGFVGFSLIIWSLMLTLLVRVYKQNTSSDPYVVKDIIS